MPSNGIFDISQKPNEALRNSDGDSAKYKMWSDRMKHHMASGNTAWKTLLKPLERDTNPITREWLEDQWIDGTSAWLLSEKLETFMCRWVSDTIYSQKTQLCGGRSAVWQRLRILAPALYGAPWRGRGHSIGRNQTITRMAQMQFLEQPEETPCRLAGMLGDA
jgi:hypothetical protein